MKIDLSTARLAPHTCRVAVVGIGGGGANVLREMPPIWSDTFKAYVLDADPQSMTPIEGIEVIHLNSRSSQGMSTGGDVESGRRLIHENRDLLVRNICASADLLFIVACLGGGTGTGGAPALAELASDTGALIVGFITLPFDFEGEARMKTALEGVRALQQQSDTLMLIRNQRLLRIDEGHTDLKSAFRTVSSAVNTSVQALWRLINQPGLINLDMADIRRMAMSSQGLCVLASAGSDAPDRTSRVLTEVLDNPLFDNRSTLETARSVIVGIAGGPDMTLQQIDQIMRAINEVLPKDTRITFGTAIDPDLAEHISLTLLASESIDEPAPVPPPDPDARTSSKTGKTRGRRSRSVQSKLNLDSSGKGRFKDVEPTLRNGEDLDVPTFIRRGIEISAADS